jgi:ribosomal-protein-alanine N-acetyltransferase
MPTRPRCTPCTATPTCASACRSPRAPSSSAPRSSRRRGRTLAVCGNDGNLIGAARLGLGEWKSAQFGIALRPDQWGHGRGTETVRLLFHLGFRDLGVHRIWGARSPRNHTSGRLMAAAGMTEDGTIRSHVLRHGVWEDSATASILEDEFTG